MALVVVCSAKSRPGVTTVALGLAAVLPAQASPVVVECDPAGGDLAARHGLTVSPGLVEVVVAPSGGAQTRVALGVLARPGQVTLNPLARTVIADCGRLDFASPAWPLVGMADAVWVLARGRLDEVAHLREHAPELMRAAGTRLTVVLAAGGVYGTAEVADVLACDGDEVIVRGPLPYDDQAARLLGGEQAAGRRWRRLPLLAALEKLTAPWSTPTLVGAHHVGGTAGGAEPR